jgi:hypothetical protein
MNGFRASSQAKDNCAAVAFFLSANCLTSSTTGGSRIWFQERSEGTSLSSQIALSK